MRKVRTYVGDDIAVQYDAKRCIHAAECVHGLPGVFDPERRPWIRPEGADAEAIAEVVGRCPTGALRIGPAAAAPEAPDRPPTIRLAADGPLMVRGDVLIEDSEGRTVSHETRVALCRCGASKNKPFCDNSHVAMGFRGVS